MANVTRMSLTCYEEVRRVNHEDVTRMIYEDTAPLQFRLASFPILQAYTRYNLDVSIHDVNGWMVGLMLGCRNQACGFIQPIIYNGLYRVNVVERSVYIAYLISSQLTLFHINQVTVSASAL